MQILSILSALCAGFLIFMNYQNKISINILNKDFAQLLNLSPHTYGVDLAVYTLIIFILGILSVLLFYSPLYKSLKEKYSAYKRELEKGSITNTSSEAKIEVLENKITVLEKALDEALKKKD